MHINLQERHINIMKLSILGSTGSIGTQALEVVSDLKGIKDIEVTAISGKSNIKLLEAQARAYQPKIVATADEDKYQSLKTALSDTNIKVLAGREGLFAVAEEESADTLLSSVVGFAGLEPTFRAIEAGKNIALANKETLVTAGSLFMEKVKEKGVQLMPVDSEHSAIFQCLLANNDKKLRRILLTASGGPFFGKSKAELENVTLKDALKHPTWAMGAKITIDSATLMNKGLEVLEAKWLFDTEIDDIEVVVHRESIIHSAVEFVDKSVIAQMSLPSMKHPIQYAFTYPERLLSKDEPLDLKKLANLTFFDPDEEAFPLLALAKKAGKLGGIMPTVLNAANETAVYAFLDGKIKFNEIPDYVEKTMSEYKNIENPSLSDIIKTDKSVRERKVKE